MERFLESVGLITGTVKNLEAINGECFLKKDADKGLIPNRKEIVKVIKDLQSLLFPNYFNPTLICTHFLYMHKYRC